MKWIKASERLPAKETTYHLKIDGRPGFGKWYADRKEFGFESTNGFGTLYQYQFEMVEWLDESKQDGWVSVEDAPNAKQYVLCYGSGGRQFAALYDNNTFMAYNPFNDELEECEEVTHWQPLPAPPSTDKQ